MLTSPQSAAVAAFNHLAENINSIILAALAIFWKRDAAAEVTGADAEEVEA